MARWEMHDGNGQVGPLEEDHVLRMIAHGIPEETVIRAEGEEEWRSLRSHARFAIALARKGAPAAEVLEEVEPEPEVVEAPPIAFVAEPAGFIAGVRRWITARSTTELVILGGCFVTACVSFAACAAAFREPPPMQAPAAPPQPVFVAVEPPKPVPAMPTSVPSGSWAKVPMPGVDLEDTGATRLKYMSNVLREVPGEPKIRKAQAQVLMQKLRAQLAKQCTVPVSSISANVGEESASLVVTEGTMADLNVRGEPMYFPVCSEALLGSSILTAGLSKEDFAKAGVRGVLCKSDGCTAIFDMRPTAPGGGVYGGSSCLSMADMMRLAGLPVDQ